MIKAIIYNILKSKHNRNSKYLFLIFLILVSNDQFIIRNAKIEMTTSHLNKTISLLLLLNIFVHKHDLERNYHKPYIMKSIPIIPIKEKKKLI